MEFGGKVGIISPYKEQVRIIKKVFISKFGNGILNEIDFNTVDGFQGQEKEIIIMSCVRASQSGSVGFLSDFRRMNVALTRAKTTLWILGNESSLRRNAVWNRLLTDATDRGCISKAYPGFLAKCGNKRKNIDTDDKQSSKKPKHTDKSNATPSAPTTQRNVQDIRNNNSKPVPRPTNAGYLPNKKEPSKEPQKKQRIDQPRNTNPLAVPTKRPKMPKSAAKQQKQNDTSAPKPYGNESKPTDANGSKPPVN